MKLNKPMRLLALLLFCLAVPLFAAGNIDPDTSDLIKVAGEGDTVTVKSILDAGADVNPQTNVAWTALMVAAEKGNTDTVKALVAATANVNAQNMWGHTALMWAARDGHTDTVKALIAAGAGLNAQG